MRVIQRIALLFYNIYVALTFIIMALIIYAISVFSLLLPSSKRANFIYAVCRFGFDVCLFIWGINHRNIFESPHDPTQPVIFIFNHISYIDTMIILKAIRNQHIRGLGKAEVAKIPFVGFIYKSVVIMVKRDNATDRARSVADMKKALSENLSIILAPEGTFNMTTKPLTKFYDGAFRIAIETQTPLKPLIFLDTFNRMHYRSIFSVTPGRSRVIFLEQIDVIGYTLDDLPLLKQKVMDKMEAKLIEYKASWIKD
jgi:1-acyl-sn-glycerol-3-phosphate acyltransferase